jgi:small subunit ribosomal protein S17
MADEKDKTEETTAAEVSAADTASASAAEETPAADVQEEAAPVEAAPVEAAPAVAPVAAESAPKPKGEPQVVLPPKERRAAKRAVKADKVPTRSETSPEDRQAERDAARTHKAAARTHERTKTRAKYKAAEHERVPTPAREHVAGIQKVRQGIVVSDKADKTITVRIDVARRHRKYQKIVRSSSTVHAHDERNDAGIGDTVVVQESRPLSATKRWRLVQVVERAK